MDDIKELFAPILDFIDEAEKDIARIKNTRRLDSQLCWIAWFIALDFTLIQVKNKLELFEMANNHMGPIEFVEAR